MTQAMRHPLEMLRIVEEGRLAQRQYQLAEHLRDHNLSSEEFERMQQAYVPQEPLPFPSRDAALHYLAGNYDQCLMSLAIKKEEKVEANRKGGKRKMLDQETVELVAQDLIENPRCSPSAIARRWNISDPSVFRIKWAEHPALTPETCRALKKTFGSKALPSIVPDTPVQTPQPPEPQPTNNEQSAAPEEASETPPQRPEEQPQMPLVPSPVPEYKPSGIAPRSASERQDGNRSIKEMLEEVRVAMDRNGISHISLPLTGPIVVQRTEILV